MRVIANLEIETTDYEGEIFMGEIEDLIADIDGGDEETRLVGFAMYQKGQQLGDDSRDFWWNEDN